MSARRTIQIALAGLSGAACATALASLAVAQSAPQSILPPGFDDPVATPTPAPTPQQGAPAGPANPPPGATVQPLPAPLPTDMPPLPTLPREELARLPSLDEIENMSTDEIDELLGLKPKFDIPPGARRTLTRVGLLSVSEGGLPPLSLANQPESLVRAALGGTRGPLVSRWGHILLRRALASRLAAPLGMDPADFAALRAGALNAIGEYTITRALAQDIDTNDWNGALTEQALVAYMATGDMTGACPAVRLQGSVREDAQWKMWQAICNAYAGESALAATQLDRALGQGIAPRIDVLLARRYAGAAGRGRRAVEIEWQGVSDLNPWRFGLAHALGEPVPANLVDEALTKPGGAYYARAGAVLPTLPFAERVRFAPRAASEGILSAAAMVDLYSQLYAEPAGESAALTRAGQLRDAYTARDPAARIAAMKQIWEDAGSVTSADGYGARVLTAYAAARITASADHADDAGELIGSMLTAGLDRDAAAWRNFVEPGSLGWALIALAQAQRVTVSQSAVDDFASDYSPRRAALLVAGLAGLERISNGDAAALGDTFEAGLTRQTRWTRAITRAAAVDNAALVVLLAGLGMQGDSWQQMTPLHLYHITSALRRVGLEAEARMIAAEAVARSG